MYCNNCGTEITENIKYCSECGEVNPNYSAVAINSKNENYSANVSDSSNPEPEKQDKSEMFVLRNSVLDSDSEAEGKNVAVIFRDSDIAIYSEKQKRGIDAIIDYSDIHSAHLKMSFDILALLSGAAMLFFGIIMIVYSFEHTLEWYQKLYSWGLALCGLLKLIYDITKKEVNIVCKNGMIVRFRTMDKNAAAEVCRKINSSSTNP